MRTVIEDEEEIETSDTELTLGMKSLLGVFFGAVLICGIFFGFGYSMGRGKTPPGGAAGESPAAKSTALAVKTVVSDPSSTAAADDENSSSTVTNSQASDSQTSSTMPANQTQSSPYEYIPGPDGPIRKPIGKPLPNPALKIVALAKPSAAVSKPVPPPPPTPVEAVTPKPAPTPVPQSPAATDTTSTTMVQIAAISRQEDADVLVSALKKHGYSAAIRREPKDNLLHVQVGPFSRDEARATRAKLLSDGYNAILK